MRDRIPELVEGSGGSFTLAVLEESDMWGALNCKLLEEAEELRVAEGDHRVEEFADVYEVLLALMDSAGVTLDEVVAAADRKRSDRGGFQSRLWMSDYHPG